MPGVNKSCLECHKFDYAPEKEELVTELMVIARELEHLQMVHDLIKKAKDLPAERKDHYE
jgi:hypothetical protein